MGIFAVPPWACSCHGPLSLGLVLSLQESFGWIIPPPPVGAAVTLFPPVRSPGPRDSPACALAPRAVRGREHVTVVDERAAAERRSAEPTVDQTDLINVMYDLGTHQ